MARKEAGWRPLFAVGALLLFAFIGFQTGLFNWVAGLLVNHAIESQMEVSR